MPSETTINLDIVKCVRNVRNEIVERHYLYINSIVLAQTNVRMHMD